MDARAFIHRVEPPAGEARLALLLLHGTGGNETDLLPLGRAVAPDAVLISPRGTVLENGMPRFFRRFSEGVFDEADVIARAAGLAGFASEAATRHALGLPVAALGYSNGANIAAAVMLLHPGVIPAAVLLRAVVPLMPKALPDLSGSRALVLSGIADQIAPPEEGERLASLLRTAGARAEALGRAFSRLAIPLGEVLTSPVFRARDTAELAFGAARTRVAEFLTADDYTHDAALLAQRIAETRWRLTVPPASGNDILVGHIIPLGMVLGRSLGQGEFAEGTLALFRPGRAAPELMGFLHAGQLIAAAG